MSDVSMMQILNVLSVISPVNKNVSSSSLNNTILSALYALSVALF